MTGPGKNRPVESDTSAPAVRLAQVHRGGAALDPETMAELPANLESAFEVQREVAALLEAEAAGWKVAATPMGMVYAPIFKHLTVADGADWPGERAAPHGLELEIAVRLRPESRSLGEPRKAVAEVFLGLELLGGRFRPERPVTFPAFLADNLGNAGYVVGKAVDFTILQKLETARCRVEIDGATAFEGPARHPDGDPLKTLRGLMETPDFCHSFLLKRPFFTTGSLCGVLPLERPARINAEIEGFGRVACRFG